MIKRVATALVVAICIAGCSSTTTSSSPSRPTTAAPERKATTTTGAKLPSCPAAVDAVAAGPDTASVAVDNPAAYLSFRACGPSNGANGARDWETWANYDQIPKGSTDVHDVLAVYCQNADPHRTTKVCQDSIIVGLTNAMNIFNVYIPGL